MAVCLYGMKSVTTQLLLLPGTPYRECSSYLLTYISAMTRMDL